MDPHHPRKTSTPFEYFLYAAILAETALAALIYKFIFRSHEMAGFRIYFAIFYFAFLAWAIAQLHLLHRDRNPPVDDSTPVAPPEAALPLEASEPMRHPEHLHQETVDENTRPLLGLTGPQLVIVVVVFATAVATFSCALSLMR